MTSRRRARNTAGPVLRAVGSPGAPDAEMLAGLRSNNPLHPCWMPGRKPGEPYGVDDYEAARDRLHAARLEFAQVHGAIVEGAIDWPRLRRLIGR